jgi:probable addiction module antidote protein
MNENITVSPWDAAKFLKDQEDIDLYLEAAFETGDPKQITKALGNAARSQGMINVADKTGLTREHLYTSLSENGNPTLQTLTTVIDTLGYQLAVIPKTNRQTV